MSEATRTCRLAHRVTHSSFGGPVRYESDARWLLGIESGKAHQQDADLAYVLDELDRRPIIQLPIEADQRRVVESAMAAGLTDRVWSIKDLLTLPRPDSN
jgi:hypothetical protein